VLPGNVLNLKDQRTKRQYSILPLERTFITLMRSAPDALDVGQSRPERKRDPSEVSHVTNEVKATGIGQTTLAAFVRFFSLKCVRDFIRDLQYRRWLASEQIEPLREREGLA
jgi:hypothetical protein